MWIAGMDLACLLVACVAGITIRFRHEEIRKYVFDHLDGWFIFIGGVLLGNYLAGSYRPQHTFSRFNLVVTWIFTMIFGMLILSITSYAWLRILLGRGVLFHSVVIYGVLSLALKMLLYRSLFRSNLFLYRTAILGCGARAKKIRQLLCSDAVMPSHEIVAFVRMEDGGEAEPPGGGLLDGVPVMRSAADKVQDFIRSLGANLVAIGPDDPSEAAKLFPHLRRLRFEGIEVLTALGVAEIFSGRMPLDLVGEDFLLHSGMEAGRPMIWRFKRLFDVVVAFAGILFFLPLAAVVAVMIKLGAPRSPVFYSQIRTGQFGKTFRIFKFRTMREGAEADTGPVWSAPGDPRITALGKILRRFRLDEVPQLLNVLKGEMSIVGPRPERPEIASDLERQIPFYAERENVMPGLTGWAQIRYPYGATAEDAARKVEYDLYYIKHLTFALDVQIILSTLRIVLFGKERRM